MQPGWLKFAILGSTYARALTNAATRGGRALAPAMESRVSQIAAQPNAQLRPGLGQFFREHAGGGELPATPQSDAMRSLAARLPWQGAEHGGGVRSLEFANRLLDQRGLSSTTPGGQAAFHQQKVTNLPLAPKTREQTTIGQAPGWRPSNPTADYQKHLLYQDRVLDKYDQHRQQVDPGFQPARQRAHAPTMPVTPAAAFMRGNEGTAIMRPNPGTPTALPTTPPAYTPSSENTAVLRPQPAAGATQVLRKTGAALPIAAGAAIPLAVGGALLAHKPGIRADIANSLHTPGDIHQQDAAQEIPAEVQAQAARAAQVFAERGIDPSAMRFAVDAPSGAGKTVLSRALAQQMGLRHHGLDWRPHLRAHQLMGGGDIEKTPYAPHAGEILEHQQLLRSYDPELFDAAIHIVRDPETIRQQVLQRGRSARVHDLLDYDKSIDVGRRAFDTLGGDAIDLGGGTMMKLRPQAGWGNALDDQLAAGGIDPTGLSRHQKLLSLHSGKREEHGAGWTPYVKYPFSGAETAAIGASIPLGVMAARALARRPR